MYAEPENRSPLPPRERHEDEVTALQREVLHLVAALCGSLRGLAVSDAVAEVRRLRCEIEVVNRLRESGL
jgi:hypothetical protein